MLSTETVFIHPRCLLMEYPAVSLDDMTMAKFRNGAAVNLPDLSPAPLVRVFRGQSDLVGMARRIAGTLFRPIVVLL